jgi:hypothetical protein
VVPAYWGIMVIVVINEFKSSLKYINKQKPLWLKALFVGIYIYFLVYAISIPVIDSNKEISDEVVKWSLNISIWASLIPFSIGSLALQWSLKRKFNFGDLVTIFKKLIYLEIMVQLIIYGRVIIVLVFSFFK